MTVAVLKCIPKRTQDTVAFYPAPAVRARSHSHNRLYTALFRRTPIRSRSPLPERSRFTGAELNWSETRRIST